MSMAPEGAQEPFVPKGGVFGFFLMVFGMFMAILDIQIVASSLPQIQAGVSTSVDEITWVQTSYLVAEVVMIPLSGWLAAVMSTRWLFAASSLGFTIMSLACALAWDVESLIFFRALQGFLGGAMIPSVFAANYKLFPPERRMIGTVVIGLTATMAPAAGPTVGGYITELSSWHWLFAVNLLPGLIITLGVPMVIDVDRANWHLLKRGDILGIILLGGFLGSLELVLDEGPREDWFQSNFIVVFSLVSVLCAIAFFIRELVIDHPVVDLRTFKDRNFTLGCLLTFVLGMCLYGQSYILPQILSHVRNYNSLQVGEVMFVTGTSMFLSSPLVGRLSAKVDTRFLLCAGYIIAASGLWLNSQMTVEVGFDELLWPQILRGVGLIVCIVPITNVALGTLPLNQVSGGSGLFNLFRNMGGALGLSLINTNWDSRFDSHYWWLVERLSNTSQVVQQHLSSLAGSVQAKGVTTLPSENLAQKILSQQIAQQANVMAWNDIFYMMAVLFLLAMPLVFFLQKPKSAGAVAEH